MALPQESGDRILACGGLLPRCGYAGRGTLYRDDDRTWTNGACGLVPATTGSGNRYPDSRPRPLSRILGFVGANAIAASPKYAHSRENLYLTREYDHIRTLRPTIEPLQVQVGEKVGIAASYDIEAASRRHGTQAADAVGLEVAL
jgi:hypothetical protein